MFVPNIWLLMPTLTDSLHCQRFSLVVTRYNRILRVLFYVVWSYVYFTLASPLNIFTCATYSMSMSLNDDVIYAWHWLPGELPIPFRLSVLCWRFNLTFNKRHVFGVICHHVRIPNAISLPLRKRDDTCTTLSRHDYKQHPCLIFWVLTQFLSPTDHFFRFALYQWCLFRISDCWCQLWLIRYTAKVFHLWLPGIIAFCEFCFT